jgi:hypothetical protein
MDPSVDRKPLIRTLASGRSTRELRGPAPRVCVAGRLRAVLSAALVMLAFPLAACGSTGDGAEATASPRGVAGGGNWNFERGDFRGWRTLADGSGAWHVYRDGATPPDPSDSDSNFPFAVPDPPEGKFAAVTDMSAPGRRILYRDVHVNGPQRLRLALFYDNHVVGQFSTPTTLAFEGCRPNQQFRIDAMNPSAPIDSMSPRAILATLFRTAAGDPAKIGATTKTFDLSRWEGRTIRLRFAQVDNRGPLRAGIDDVRLERTRP